MHVFGKSIGPDGTVLGNCFNTGMTGYQEIFTDLLWAVDGPANAHGNYEYKEDEQSDSIKISGLICKNFSYEFSRPLADISLKNYLIKNKLFGISDLDTRALVNYIRENGAMNAVISTEIEQEEALIKKLSELPSMEGLELASKVSTKEPYFVGNPDADIKLLLSFRCENKYFEAFV